MEWVKGLLDRVKCHEKAGYLKVIVLNKVIEYSDVKVLTSKSDMTIVCNWPSHAMSNFLPFSLHVLSSPSFI